MKTETLLIEKGQYLSDILAEIPTNTIVSKTIPGCGATTLEIETKRNSIIIVPNVPVIHSKCSKYPNLLGVYEGVTVQDIIDYLRTDIPFKKLITTPESYPKIKMAMEKMRLDMFANFFCLMDECHLLIKDIDYRSDIILPIDDFFSFRGKALVTATLLEFTDPRFNENNFRILSVEPNYKYGHDIVLIHVNDVFSELEFEFKGIKKNTFFFLNSIDLIFSIVNQLGIAKDSSIFCSSKSRVKLIGEYNFKHAYTVWNPNNARKFNFFTARFYNAFDLELDYKPSVFLITDVYKAEYTMFDVNTDSVQIVGRFRNGVNNIFHIYNTCKDFDYLTRQQAEREIYAHQKAYEVIKSYYENATTIEERRAYGQALESLPYGKLLLPDGRKNFFAIDNKINELTVKSLYKEDEFLDEEYRRSPHFYPFFDGEYYPPEIRSKLVLIKTKETVKEKRKISLEILCSLEKPYNENDHNILTEIRKIDPLIVEAFEKLGVEKIEELKFSEKKMKEALILASRKSNKTIQMVKNSFKTGYKYSNEAIVKELTRIYAELGIHPDKIIKGSMILDYFKALPTKVKGDRGYYLIDEKV